MRMDVLVRNRAAVTGVLFAVALALALIAALQAQARLSAPSIPLLEQRIQPTNVETSAQPAVPATVAPGVVPTERETIPVTPASEADRRPNATAAPVPADLPASPALPAQPKAAPADGRPMGDHDLPPLGTRAWKGGVDY